MSSVIIADENPDNVSVVISTPKKDTIDALKAGIITVAASVISVSSRISNVETSQQDQNTAIASLQAQVKALMSLAPRRSKIYVPLFMWPFATVNGVRQLSPHWQAVIDAKKACPDVIIYACINVGSGDYFLSSGLWDSTNFTTMQLNPDIARGVQALEQAGVFTGIYTYSSYGARSIDVIKQRIDLARRLFPNAKFMFIDEEMGNLASVPFYKSITSYAKSAGFDFTIGNPGASIAKEAVGACDVTLIYEEYGLPSLAIIDSRTFGMDKKYFGMIPHSVATYDSTLVCNLMKRCELFYATNDSTIAGQAPDNPDTNPWNTTSAYMPKMMADALSTGIMN